MARPKRGPSGKRVGWSKLRPATRARYESAGISRADWEAGVDLRTARGHTPAPPPYRAPVDTVTAMLAGEASTADLSALRDWAASKTAPWWTRGLDSDVAAALSQIPWPPSQWRDVLITPSAEGPWTMRVIPKGRPNIGIETDRNGNEHAVTAYDVVIQIPGGGAPGDGGRSVLDLLTFGPEGGAGEDNQRWRPVGFDMMGSV